MYFIFKATQRYLGIFTCILLFSGCGTVRMEVPEGHEVRVLERNESAEVRVERTVWFWLWGARAISDNTTKSDIEKYHFKEVRAYTTQTMTDNIILMLTGLVTIVRRTLIIEGNTDSALPANVPVAASVEEES